jgi:titin
VVAGAPDAVRSPSATPGNNRATLRWTTAPNNGAAITGYVITPYLGAVAQTPRAIAGTAPTATITGLTNARSYTFRIAAVNARGTGPQSLSTTAITVGAPGAPTGVSATPAARSATVHWVAANGNGVPVTGYVITPYLGPSPQAARVVHAKVTTLAVGGLGSGKAYTFTVAAINARGTGPQSQPSRPITVR